MNNLKLTIDGRAVEVAPGSYVLAAAKSLGIDIPTMCFSDACKPFTSCMVCVVKNLKTGNLITACSALVEEGMELETDSDDVRTARRVALELLLSDHLGDCEAPCQYVCPSHIDVPRVLRAVAGGDYKRAAKVLIESVGSSDDVCKDCKAPCEKVCRRAQSDAAVSIRMVIKFAREIQTELFSGNSSSSTAGKSANEHKKRFNCSIGKLKSGEFNEFLKRADSSLRIEPAGGIESGFVEAEAVQESARCLHCDCRKSESCKLREYSDVYGAKQRRYKAEERASFRQVRQLANVIYEPGKCIKCGLCVRITELNNEPLGLTFIGRGFDVCVRAPFSKSLAEALTETAVECVNACPTAALAFEAE